jgi:hypothetical protein
MKSETQYYDDNFNANNALVNYVETNFNANAYTKLITMIGIMYKIDREIYAIDKCDKGYYISTYVIKK